MRDTITLRRNRRVPHEMRAHLKQAARWQYGGAFGERGLRGVFRGQHEGAARAARTERHGERAAHRTQLTGERELAGEFMTLEASALQLPPPGGGAGGH